MDAMRTGRVAAALAAGGTLVNDRFAPMWWTLADPEGNEVDLATWVGRDWSLDAWAADDQGHGLLTEFALTDERIALAVFTRVDALGKRISASFLYDGARTLLEQAGFSYERSKDGLAEPGRNSRRE
jgi:Glyoxalase-like domain